MVEIKTQYPYLDENGNEHFNFIKHYAEDETGQHYIIKQKETGNLYEEAIDIYPCVYSYEATTIKVEKE